MQRLFPFLIVFLACLTACTTPLTMAQPTPTPEGPQAVTLRFAAQVNDQVAQCDQAYSNIGLSQNTISFTDLRFYVSNIRLVNAAGTEVPVTLTQDELWQHADTALLDFENGSGGCRETGNDALNAQVVGTVPADTYTAIAFDMGVPFDLNHADVTTAASPLNVSAMWWNWQSGYKFMRVDLMIEDAELPAYNMHVGSTGCEAPDMNSAPDAPCSKPNMLTVRLDNFDPTQDTIVADIGALLAEVDIAQNAPEPPGCMSMAMDTDCPALFTGLGLSLEEGICPDGNCANQRLFRTAAQ